MSFLKFGEAKDKPRKFKPPLSCNPDRWDKKHKGFLPKLKLEISVSTIGQEGKGFFGESNIAAPNEPILLKAPISTKKLAKYFAWDYFKGAGKGKHSLPGGYSWWIGGMQCWTMQEVFFITDDPNNGIFIFYPMQNNHDYMQFLGKLIDGYRMTEMVRKQFKDFLKGLANG